MTYVEELREKLTAAREFIRAIGRTNHHVFGHEGVFEKCDRPVCTPVKDVLERTKP